MIIENSIEIKMYICTFTTIMNVALVSIGSNENREENLSTCRRLLSSIFSNIVYSGTLLTPPYGDNYKADFLNQLALIHCKENIPSLHTILKGLETRMGRTGDDKIKGLVKIDIDLIAWNENILKPEDFQREYIQGILKDLNCTVK